MSAIYRYIFLALRSDQVIEEIDLYGVSCLRQLNGPGQFTASFKLNQSGKQNSDLIAATTPGLTWMVIERAGVPVYAGIVWSRVYQAQGKVVQLSGWGFEAYPQRRILDYNFNDGPASSTQVFLDLWTSLRGNAGSDLNIIFPSAVGGPTTSTAIIGTDYRYFGEVMDSIANASTGFDWTITITKTANGTYNKNLVIGYPNLGAQAPGANQWFFEYPGNILDYFVTDSMALAGTNLYLLGAGEGSSMVVSKTTHADMIDLFGWPRWDLAISHKDIASQSLLNGIAAQEKINFKPPAPTFKAEVAGFAEPIFGSYGLGDAVRLIITDPRFPSPDGSTAGINVNTRLIGWELHPPDSQQLESIFLLFPGDVVNG